MLQRSACCFMTIYHIVMRSIWIGWFCIPRRPTLLIYLLHYLNRTFQYIKSTVYVSYANQSMSPHIKKIENWNESIMLLFSNAPHIPKIANWNESIVFFFNADDQRLLFSSILSLVASFFARILLFAPIFPSPPVTLCVTVDAHLYVETRASTCSYWGLVCVYPDINHIDVTTQ